MNVNKIYHFEQLSFDAKSRKLTNEDDNEVTLPPRSAEVLLALLNNAGKVVEKDYFSNTVWDGTFVEPGNLAVAIASLRKAFRRLGNQSEIIKTIPKYGYRFVSDVDISEKPEADPIAKESPEEKSKNSEESEKESSPASEDSAFTPNSFYTYILMLLRLVLKYKLIVFSVIIAAVVSTIGIESRKPIKEEPKKEVKLVIPPFTSLTPENKKYELLGYAIADKLISDFERFEDVKALPIWNTLHYEDIETFIKNDRLTRLADYIITGNYSSNSDNIITVSVKLIRTSDWQIMVDQSFDLDGSKSLTDVRDLAVQKIKVATTIFESPSTELHKLKSGEILDTAYLHYLQGFEYYASGDLEEALANFKKASELSPDFANAWLMTSRIYYIIGLVRYGGVSYVKKSERALEKALLLEPDNIYFKLDKAEIYIYLNRFIDAYDIYQGLPKEVEDEPGIYRSKAEMYMYLGLLSESIVEVEKYLEAFPHQRYTFTQFIYTGQYDRFEEKMFYSEKSAFSVFYKGYVKLYKGDEQEAIKYFDKSYELSKDLLPAQNAKVFSYILKGKPDEAKKLLDVIDSKIKDSNLIYKEGLYKVVQAKAMLGEKEAALQTLEKTIESGFLPYEYFEQDPFVKNIRDTQEFDRLMNLAKEKQEAFIKAIGLEN